MKFLLNMNMPRVLGKRLVDDGDSCRHAGDIGLSKASDVEIVAEAERGQGDHPDPRSGLWTSVGFFRRQGPFVVIFRLRDSIQTSF
jgi:hypothetical protein